MRGAPYRHRVGFTLAEGLLAASILAITVVAVTVPFSLGARNQLAEARATIAATAAQDMMEEILSLPFEDPDGDSDSGPEWGESSRSQFDNVDDYDGFFEDEGEITGFDGTPVDDPAAARLSRLVSVEYVFVAGQESAGEANFVRVEVEVRYRGEPAVTLTRLVYSPDVENGAAVGG